MSYTLPGNIFLLVTPGADLDLVTQVTLQSTGLPADFTGWGAFFCAGKDKEGNALGTWTVSVSNVDNLEVAVTPVDGWLRFELPAAESELFQVPDEDSGPADVYGTDPGGKVRLIGYIDWFRPRKRVTDL